MIFAIYDVKLTFLSMNKALVITMLSFIVLPLSAQVNRNDANNAFVPISKYILAGDSSSLSAWFADNLEVTIMGNVNECSKVQARQIMKTFFADYTPKKFEITHTSGRPPISYAVGTLHAGGAKFRVTIRVRTKEGEGSLIQQIKIDRE